MSSWTISTLREHWTALRKADLRAINRRFTDAEKAVGAALAAAEKAVTKAEAASDKRADASNEIRQAMLDQQADFARKIEVQGIERRVGLLEEFASRSAGKSTGITATTGVIYAAIAAAVGIGGLAIAIFMR